eukprot:CAMPEP_0194345608 /NCGR_PEP_ID=MMETSP0171-20130528/104954_1 /TAXON_ID=218684 /ORGANISM="Corethron pennatum, Strain L29A3" /LENGTH=727 /DNA_ID=CAMNT_0039112619 /DNA_START=587 /DNA_END=2770 /DNA_ORIENTATION=-
MDLDRYQRKIANAQEASVANNRKRLAEAEEEAKRKENEDEASPGPPQNFPPAGASHSTEGLAAASTRNPIPVEPQWSSQWARIYVTDAKIVDPKGDEIGGDGATKMSDTKDENSYVVKLTINYDCIRRICVQRLKKNKKITSLKNNIKISELRKLSIEYLEGKTVDDETTTTSPNQKLGSKLKEPYQDYDVALTYVDEDGDEITMSSDMELVQALYDLKITNQRTHVLCVNAIVSRDGGKDFYPLGSLRVACLKSYASQRARAGANQIRKYLFQDDTQLAKAIQMSFVTLAGEEAKRNSQKEKDKNKDEQDENLLDICVQSDGKIAKEEHHCDDSFIFHEETAVRLVEEPDRKIERSSDDDWSVVSDEIENLRPPSSATGEKSRRGVLSIQKIQDDCQRQAGGDAKKGKTMENSYIVGEVVGSGAFSTVHRVEHCASEQSYVMKCVVRTKLPQEDDDALQDEVAILKEFDHVHIVKLYDFFVEPEKYYLVLEEMAGGELFDRIVKKSFYAESDAKDVCKFLLEATKYCHDHNVAHRDLKPENLMLQSLSNDSNIKITDFGFAKRVHAPKSLTTQCGTPGYVAPEILKGMPYDEKADMWSVGVILYILLSGYPPFIEENQKQLFRKIKAGSYKFHKEYWRDISLEAKNFISSLLTVNPDERLSATEALQNAWITGVESHDNNDMGHCDGSIVCHEETAVGIVEKPNRKMERCASEDDWSIISNDIEKC